MGSSLEQETFTALDDISFEVKQGEALGIIGRNGAGKSTLLKVLSRITEPTKGRIEINGRVSSLLEVGTGFHPELSGRENIYLNGTILGMKRAEIKLKFDEIVAFSGVEKFIDTPVKHYSSGMKVRLAFSVAAHLEPEILIVDEVLAVGDAEFQKKCLGKMDDVSKKEGRTVLFVSHNMGAVKNLCKTGILLTSGSLTAVGSASSIIKKYLENQFEGDKALTEKPFAGNASVMFQDIRLLVDDHPAKTHNGRAQIPTSTRVRFRLTLNSEAKRKAYFAITIMDQHNNKVATLDNLFLDKPFNIQGNNIIIECEVGKLNLNCGRYLIDLWCSDGFETLQKIDQACSFDMIDDDYLKTGKAHNVDRHGYIYFDQKWRKE